MDLGKEPRPGRTGMIIIWKKVMKKKEESETSGRIWVPLSEIAKSSGGTKCAVSLESMV